MPRPPAARFSVEATTIDRLHTVYLAGVRTARDVTHPYLDRIAAYDKGGPDLNSLIHLNAHALSEADPFDAAHGASGSLTSPLHGIPVIVTDNVDTPDLPTSSEVALFRDFIPPMDAFVATRLRAAGAILLAKASLSELAMGMADTINSARRASRAAPPTPRTPPAAPASAPMAVCGRRPHLATLSVCGRPSAS